MDARKHKFTREDLPALMSVGRQVVVAKGKRSLSFPLGAEADWDEIAAVALGRSGTLRAPTLRSGDTWLVGYHADAWTESLASG